MKASSGATRSTGTAGGDAGGGGAPSPTVRKEHDSLVAVLFAGRVATWLIPPARRYGISPMQVTLASFAVTMTAAALIAGRGYGKLAALLVLAGFVLDCLDGQLARATGRASHFGGYVDSLTDFVKVFALVAASTAAFFQLHRSGWSILLGGAALFGYLLCEYHVQLARQLPQRSQRDYEQRAASWKDRLRLGGQKIDLAFAIGEVLMVIAAGAWFRRPGTALFVLALATPVQFLSYSLRFWKHRYSASPDAAR